VSFTLATNNYYTINELLTDLNNQIQNNSYFNSSESYIQINDYSNNSIYYGNSYFELSLKANRYKTNNIKNSKLVVVFPNETNTNNPIWVGNTSCFRFLDYTQEINRIISDTSPLKETSLTYIIDTNPYIQLHCIKKGYNVSTNNYTFTIPNNLINGYTLSEYVNAINTSIINVNNTYNEFHIPHTYCQIDDNNTFNLSFDINKKINQENFVIDFTGSFFNTVMNFDLSYDLLSNNVITTYFGYSSNYTLQGTIAKLYARTPNNKVNNDISYNISIENEITVSYSELQRSLLNIFQSYLDSDSENVFKNTNISLSIVDNLVEAVLTVGFQKTLTQNDYNIQFFDVSYIDQSYYTLQTSGNNLGFFNTHMGYNNVYSLNSNNTIITYFDKTKISTIDTKYIFNIQQPDNLNNYLNVLKDDYITSYLIPSPTGDYTDNIGQLETDINTILSTFSDLIGSNIQFVVNNNIVTSTLKIV
jgi:hypothetical protein